MNRTKVLLLFLPLFIILTYQIYSYGAFVNNLDHIRDNIIVPSTKQVLYTSEMRFLMVKLAVSFDRTTLFFWSENPTLLNQTIEQTLDYRKQIALRIQNLKEITNNPNIPGTEETKKQIEEFEVLINKINAVSDDIIFELKTHRGDTEYFNRVVNKISNELVPLNEELFAKTSTFLEVEASHIDVSRKIILEAEQKGLIDFYINTGALFIYCLFLLIVFLTEGSLQTVLVKKKK